MFKQWLGDWMKENGEQVLTFFIKTGAWFYYTLLGVLAKVSYNIAKGKRMSFKQQLASLGMALYIGYLTSVIGKMYFPDKVEILVPVTTLSADRLVELLLNINWRTFLNNIIAIFQKPNKTDVL